MPEEIPENFSDRLNQGFAVDSEELRTRHKNLYDPVARLNPLRGMNLSSAALGGRTSRQVQFDRMPWASSTGIKAGYTEGLKLIDRAWRSDAASGIRNWVDDMSQNRLVDSSGQEFESERGLSREEFDERVDGWDINWYEGISGPELEMRKQAAYYRALGDFVVKNGGSDLSYTVGEGIGGAGSNPATLAAVAAAPVVAFGAGLVGLGALGTLGLTAVGEGLVEGLAVYNIQGDLEEVDPHKDFDRVSEALVSGALATGITGLLGSIGLGISKVRGKRVMTGADGESGEVLDVDVRFSEKADPALEQHLQEVNARNGFEETLEDVGQTADQHHTAQNDPATVEQAKREAKADKGKEPAAGKDQTAKGSADAPEPQPVKILEDYIPPGSSDIPPTASVVPPKGVGGGARTVGLPDALSRLVYSAAGDARQAAVKANREALKRTLIDAGVLPNTPEAALIVKQITKRYQQRVQDYSQSLLEEMKWPKQGKLDGIVIEETPMDVIHEVLAKRKLRTQDAHVEAPRVGNSSTKKIVMDKPVEVEFTLAPLSQAPSIKMLAGLDFDIANAVATITAKLPTVGDPADVLSEAVDLLADVLSRSQPSKGLTPAVHDAFVASAIDEISNIADDILRKTVSGSDTALDDLAVVNPKTNTIDPEAAFGAEKLNINQEVREYADRAKKAGQLDEDDMVQLEKGQKALDDSVDQALRCGI